MPVLVKRSAQKGEGAILSLVESNEREVKSRMINEITPERRDELIEWMAQQVVKRGLSTPAVMFVEMARPISFIGSQAVQFFSPFINVALNSQLSTEIGFLMEDRKNIDRLVDRVEELTIEQDRKEKEWRKKAKERRTQELAERKAAGTGVSVVSRPVKFIGNLFRKK